MTNTARDIAKFFAGVATSETLAHWWLGFWGSDLLPIQIGGFTFSSDWNMGVMVLWPIVLAAAIYFGWLHKDGPRRPASFAPPMPT